MRRGGRAALTIAVLLLMTGQLLTTSRALADDTWAIDSWIELSATSPATDCPIDASVELRRDGYAAEGVEVLMALYVGEELISADRVVTDEDGIAFLEIDGSPADGLGGWIDVTLNDEYWWGTAASPGVGEGCTDGYLLHNEKGSIPGFAVATDDSAEAAFFADDSGSVAEDAGSGGFIPEVGFYVQQRNLSCEYAALSMATSALGAWVSEYEFDNRVGWAANPHYGFRGDINGLWGNTTDYGVYAEPLVPVLNANGFNADVFYSFGDPAPLRERLDAGRPVIAWLGFYGDTAFAVEDNGSYLLAPGMQTVVVYGYDDAGVHVADPASGSYDYYLWDDFLAMWSILDGMGLAVSPW